MPIPPTNTTPATAYDITDLLPLNDTIDLRGLSNPQTVWFKFNLNGEFGLSSWGSVTPNYSPVSFFYLGIPPNPNVGYLQSGSRGIVEFFIEEAVGIPKAGTIYIRISNTYISTGYNPDALTTIKIDKIPNIGLPANSILVSNDMDNYPLTMISPAGIPTQLRSFKSNGECAAILQNGVSIWSDSISYTKLWLYNSKLELITSLNHLARNNLRSPLSSNRVDTFYSAGWNSPAKITTISQAGEFGSTEWALPIGMSLYHIVPSFLDNDIIYTWGGGGGREYGIAKFHKSTGVLDAPIILDNQPTTGYLIGGYYGEEFLVLPDDSLVVLWQARYNNPDQRGKVIHYTSSGSIIREFIADYEDVNHIAYANDYNSFWLWSFDIDAFSSQFIQFRLSDGVRLNQFILETTSSANGFSTGLADYGLFGVPESCPFIVTPVGMSLPPYGPSPPFDGIVGAGIYELVPDKINDTIYTDPDQEDVMIPKPFAKTAYFGS